VSIDKLRVLILVGGTSAERDVSMASGQAVLEALRERGHDVLAIDTACGRKLLDTSRSLIPQGIDTVPPEAENAVSTANEVVTALAMPEAAAIDVVFLALHGGDGEDGHIQALLDMARVKYTGSGVTASALAMNKHVAKNLFESEGIHTPEWLYLPSRQSTLPEYADVVGHLSTPFVVKPNEQGSTVGLSIVKSEAEYVPAVDLAFRYGSSVLLERYIAGRELTAAILGDQVLPLVEIIPEHGLYDYECKYTSGKSKYVCPAEISIDQSRALQDAAQKAFSVLGCSGYARVDFRMNNQGVVYCLEVNTLPGMTLSSLVPKAAAAAGIPFKKLIESICRLAID